MKWKSIHIFYRGNENQDKLIITIEEKLQKYVDKGEINKWFFIRYWEGGPHIRLRIQGNVNMHSIKKDILNYLAQNEVKIHILKEEFYRNVNLKLEGFSEELQLLPWYEANSIEEIGYKPELDRYGGNTNIIYSETLFYYSTILSLNVIKVSFGKKAPMRWLIAIFLIKNLLDHLSENQILRVNTVDFLEYCYEYWENNTKNYEIPSREKLIKDILCNEKLYNQIVVEIIKESAIGEKIIMNFNIILENMENKQKIHSIIFSQIHMFFNRLGISPELEKECYAFMKGMWRNEE